jgi:hypothetical protein
MLTVSVGNEAVLNIPYVDDAGNQVVPTAVTFQVQDGDGNVLQDTTQVGFTAGQTAADITLSGAVIAAAGPRILLLSMATATGIVVSQTVFGVVATPGTRLVVLKNTFQSFAQAQFTALDLPSVGNFTGAAKTDQEVALIEAFRRLTLLNYFIPWPEFVDVMNYLYPRYAWHITPRMWPQMTVDLYNQYPAAFHQAMRQAQVVEANAVLTANPIDDTIRQGLLAWTVGESKMMFKPGVRPLKGQVSRETMNYLKGWLNSNYTLTRS